MVELCQDGCKGRVDVVKIHHPSRIGIDLTINRESHEIRMTVQALAGMSGRNHWQAVGCFKAKICVKFHGCCSCWSNEREVYTSWSGVVRRSRKNADLFVKGN